MQCPKCHGIIPDNSKFCTLCGEKLDRPVADAAGSRPVLSERPSSEPLLTAGKTGSAVSQVLGNVDFHHFDLKGLITCEAILWILPVLGLIFPIFKSSYGEGQGLFPALAEGEFDMMPDGVVTGIWVVCVLVIAIAILGFVLLIFPVKKSVPVEYATLGIILSLMLLSFFAVFDVGFGYTSMFGFSVETTLLGTLMKFSLWILLFAHCWQIWMMAVNHQRL